MFFMYLLRSKKDGSLYIGFTPDLKARLEKHNRGLVYSTKNIRPLHLIYCEGYKAKQDAMMREKQLKRFAQAYTSLKRRLPYSLMLSE